MELSIYLPPKAKSLVEFGCGSGEMGRSFKRIAPFCRYIGVEKNAALAQAARAHLDEVVTADAAAVSFEKGDEVDCLVTRFTKGNFARRTSRSCRSTIRRSIAGNPTSNSWSVREMASSRSLRRSFMPIRLRTAGQA